MTYTTPINVYTGGIYWAGVFPSGYSVPLSMFYLQENGRMLPGVQQSSLQCITNNTIEIELIILCTLTGQSPDLLI